MPTVPVPLFNRVYKNVDGTVLNDDAALQYNGYIDALGGLNIRPGEVLAINSATQSDGMFYWPDKEVIVCVEEAAVSLRAISGETLVTIASGSSVTFNPGGIVTFATDGTRVFMAGGGRINYVDIVGTVTEVADIDAPTNVTHVIFLDGYILAINNDNKMYWSAVNDGTNWSALNFASAEASPDLTQALHVVQRQIYILGSVSTEIWENDGETPFSRIPGGLIEIGCGAKYSPIRRDNSLLWLSETRQFVEFTGTDVKFISSRYDREIANFTVVSDCIGGLIHKDGQEFCIFQFPTERRTLVYNPMIDDWSEWGLWDGTSWDPYDFRTTARDIVSGKTFIGKGEAEVISCLSSDSRVDVTGAATTQPFKFLRQTGHIDHGVSKKKRLEKLSFRAKRGAANGVEDPKLMLRYRNNGSSQWSNIKEIDLGNIGEYEHHIDLYRLGIFKSRQYEISATDDISIVLSNAEADITVLR